jgi:broad specificity phosphatase PhoE
MANLFQSDLKDITRLILVRHGRTNNNKEARFGSLDDCPLDHVGQDQAKRVAKRLIEFEIDHIYSSPIQRAKETAEIMAAENSLKVIIRPELKEYDNGIIAGLTVEELRQKFPEIYLDIQGWINMGPVQNRDRFQVPEAESMDAFKQRILAFQNFILVNHPGQIVAAVSHLAVIKGFMALLFGSSLNSQMNFMADNTSVTVVDFYHQVPVLRSFNDIRHLDSKLKYGIVTAM